jgi:uncharacterized membrane protein
MGIENGSAKTKDNAVEIKSIPIKSARISNSSIKEMKIQRASMTIERSMHSGPLPAPETLAMYEKICPGLADRIVSMAENQSSHRQEIEKIAVKSGARDSLCGIICGFLIGIATIIVGYLLGVKGHTVSSSIIGTGGIVGLVSVFVYGTRSRRRERENKSK